MRSVVGYAVFAIGLAFGAYAYIPRSFDPPPFDGALAAPAYAGSVHGRVAGFSPGSVLLAPVPIQTASIAAPAAIASKRDTGILDYLSSKLTSPDETVTAVAPSMVKDVALAPWRSAVVLTAQNDGLSATKTARPADEADRMARARVIQRELKRVGCYGGAIDGVWGSASKRAMVAFIDRVNASLPLDEPDDFLLSLVKGQAPGVCGPSCPAGQTFAGDRCVPAAIVAQSARRQRVADAATTLPVPTAPKALSHPSSPAVGLGAALPVGAAAPLRIADGRMTLPDSLPLPGRMSMGAPPPADVGGDWATATTPAHSVLPIPGEQVALTDVTTTPPATSAAGEPGAAAVSSFSTTAVPPPTTTAAPSRSKSSSSRSERTASHGYKSVQRLFEHPLGRM